MWTLYCLATNPEAQEKLRSEVKQVVGESEIVTPEHVGRMPYLRNVVRETQRYLASIINFELYSTVCFDNIPYSMY